MNIFGSREEDPLLQDDPLAPSSDEEDAAEETEDPGDNRATDSNVSSAGENLPAKTDASDGQPTESSSTPADPEQPPSLSAGDTTGDTERVGSNHFAFGGDGPSRTIARGLDELEEGNLTMLNAAFDQGWRLRRIEHKHQMSELLFVLRREEAREAPNRIV